MLGFGSLLLHREKHQRMHQCSFYILLGRKQQIAFGNIITNKQSVNMIEPISSTISVGDFMQVFPSKGMVEGTVTNHVGNSCYCIQFEEGEVVVDLEVVRHRWVPQGCCINPALISVEDIVQVFTSEIELGIGSIMLVW